MLVIKKNKVACFDIDQTLLMWEDVDKYEQQVTINGRVFGVNHDHVKRLMDHASLGHELIVWSKSGYQHAEATVKALKLEKIVAVAMDKPSFLYDDAPITRTLPHTQYVGDLPKSDQLPDK